MADKNYTVKVALAGDTRGLVSVESALNRIDKKAKDLSTKTHRIDVEVGGSGLRTLKDIESKLSSIRNRTIKVDVGGTFESSLKKMEGHLDKISKNVSTKVDVKGHANKDLENIQAIKDKLEKPISVKMDVDSTAFNVLAGELNAIDSKLGSVDNALKGLSMGSNDGGMGRFAEDINAVSSRVGSLQDELNSLSAPEITPKINMPDLNQYYASFDGLGHMSLGAMGGTSILSMLGLQGVKGITWGNALAEETNDQLLRKMPASKTGATFADKIWEGGGKDGNNIAHAVTQDKTVRKAEFIPGFYSFQVGTDASYEDLNTNLFGGQGDDYYGKGTGADVLAYFQQLVQQLDGPVRAQSAVFDLSKAYDGAFASVDQYGVREEKLKEYGFDPKDKNKTVSQFLYAVGKAIRSEEPNTLVTDTMEGGMTMLRKRFNNSGQKIGAMLMEPVGDVANVFTWFDKQDWNFMGLTIPKGTLTQGIIGVTGLISSIDPLQRTVVALKDTFHKVTGAVNKVKDSFQGLVERIGNLGSWDKLKRFKDFGAYGVVAQDKYAREHGTEILRGNINRISQIKGIHEFSEEDIDNSNMTWIQRSRTKNAMKADKKLFALEKAETLKRHKQIHDDLIGGEDIEFEKSIVGLSEMDKIQARHRESQERMSRYDTGRLNELNKLSNWDKIKQAFKSGFTPQTTAFKKGFSYEKSKYKDKGFWKQAVGKTWGNIKGIGAGFKEIGKTGGLKSALGGIGGVIRSVITAINPFTIIMYALTAGIAALSAVFLIAYSNSKTFRDKLGELNEKLHELFDAIVFTVGDLLQSSGITEHGGAEGISEAATKMVGFLCDLVDYVKEIVLSMSGRDLTASKKIEPLDKKAEQNVKKIQEKEKEVGKGNAPDEMYQELLNTVDQIAYYDPTYITDDKLDKWGLRDIGYTDPAGDTLENWLQRDISDKSSSYFNEDKQQELEGLAIHVQDGELYKAVKNNGSDSLNAKEMEEFNKAVSAHRRYIMTDGAEGTLWNDSAFVKAHPFLYSEEQASDAEKLDGGINSKILGNVIRIFNLLDFALKAILLGIGALIAAKLMEGYFSVRNKVDDDHGWWDVIKDKIEGKVEEKFPETTKARKKGESSEIELPDGTKKKVELPDDGKSKETPTEDKKKKELPSSTETSEKTPKENKKRKHGIDETPWDHGTQKPTRNPPDSQDKRSRWSGLKDILGSVLHRNSKENGKKNKKNSGGKKKGGPKNGLVADDSGYDDFGMGFMDGYGGPRGRIRLGGNSKFDAMRSIGYTLGQNLGFDQTFDVLGYQMDIYDLMDMIDIAEDAYDIGSDIYNAWKSRKTSKTPDVDTDGTTKKKKNPNGKTKAKKPKTKIGKGKKSSFIRNSLRNNNAVSSTSRSILDNFSDPLRYSDGPLKYGDEISSILPEEKLAYEGSTEALEKGLKESGEQVGKEAGKGVLERIGTWFGEKGIGKIFTKAGEKLASYATLSEIPIIGALADVAWIGWDVTDWFGNYLDETDPARGKMFEMTNPFRFLQKNWGDVLGGAFNLMPEWLQSSVGGAFGMLPEWLQNPIMGAIDQVRGINSYVAENYIKPAGEWFSGIESWIGNSVMGSVGGGLLNSVGGFFGGNTQSYGQSNYIGTSSPYSSYAQNAAVANTGYGYTYPQTPTTTQTNTQPPTEVTNNITVNGVGEDRNYLVDLVIRTLNEHIFWDAQKAGRNVDTSSNGLGGLF